MTNKKIQSYQHHFNKPLSSIQVDSWVVKELPDGNDYWQLLGARNPLLPQMFQPVNDTGVVIQEGDTVSGLSDVFQFPYICIE